MSQNPYAPPEAEVGAVAPTLPSSPAPALWNPNAAAMWSLLLTPAFGAFLHMKNWTALGEHGKADTSRKWFIGLVAAMVVLSIVSIWLPESKLLSAFGRGAGIGMLVAWYVGSGKPQVAYVLGRYGKTYPRRGWLSAVLLGIAAMVALLAAIVALNLAVSLVFDVEPA